MADLPPPQHYVLALFPGFQLLDAAGPLDILNLLSMTQAKTSNVTLTIIASTLDPVPVKPIPPIDPKTHEPKWTYTNFPTINNKSNTTFSQSWNPDITFDSYLAALSDNSISEEGKHKPIDVLFIPGGVGTRINRKNPSTGEETSNTADLISFIAKISPHIRHSILTVCTGSAVLGQTGLLDGRRATTNMARFEDVVGQNPGVKWLKGRRWVRSLPSEVSHGGGKVVFEKDIWTSAGISAGIDLMFAFVAHCYGGVEFARWAARTLEYEWREIGEGVVDPMYGLEEEEVNS